MLRSCLRVALAAGAVSLGLLAASPASAQDQATLERCASRYGAAANLVEAKKKGDARFAGWALPANAANLPLRARSLETEEKLLAAASAPDRKMAISDKVVADTVEWVDGVAKNGRDFAEAVFAGARRCDQDLKYAPVLDEMPAPVAAPATGASANGGQDSTLSCAVNYYFAANVTRRQDLLGKASEAMRRYAAAKGLAPAAVQADVVAKSRAMASAPPKPEALQTVLTGCDSALRF